MPRRNKNKEEQAEDSGEEVDTQKVPSSLYPNLSEFMDTDDSSSLYDSSPEKGATLSRRKQRTYEEYDEYENEAECFKPPLKQAFLSFQCHSI